MAKTIIKPRYQEITLEIIKSIKTEGDLLKQSDLLFEEEHYKLDNAIELTGGKVSRVYKINNDGTNKVLKISTGLYRMTELKREAEILRDLMNYGCEDLVPNIVTFNERENYSYLVEDFVEGETVRQRLAKCESKEVRSKLWRDLGKALSHIHELYQVGDLENSWLDGQLGMARMNMENNLLDSDEFEEETPEEMLEFLILNKPERKQLSLIHGDFRTKNIMIDNDMNYKIIDWGFVDLGDPYYDLAIIDYYFKTSNDRESFYEGYRANNYNKDLILYFDKLSKFINV